MLNQWCEAHQGPPLPSCHFLAQSRLTKAAPATESVVAHLPSYQNCVYSVRDSVEEVRVKLLDKADAHDIIDAEVVAVRDGMDGGISCWMRVRRSNFHPRKVEN
ncbi:hypothetical protein L6164_013643 [Bauhinia variegata]|uniref:Uncharacterized protein n=1 Tax=Bauhinia variegata TaxID=167791 RepID=A0ACB9NEQ1_BAUVA|nr:hypothetical protein L6164_013643 [Bauhinia variegata]